MKLRLQRESFTDKATEGRLFINDKFECYTLEDCDRRLEDGGEKIKGFTAIPRGIYPITITFSNHFQKPLALLGNVPNYEGVRIHAGNTDADTDGCILVGLVNEDDDDDFIGKSRDAITALQAKIAFALSNGDDVSIEIV